MNSTRHYAPRLNHEQFSVSRTYLLNRKPRTRLITQVYEDRSHWSTTIYFILVNFSFAPHWWWQVLTLFCLGYSFYFQVIKRKLNWWSSLRAMYAIALLDKSYQSHCILNMWSTPSKNPLCTASASESSVNPQNATFRSFPRPTYTLVRARITCSCRNQHY